MSVLVRGMEMPTSCGECRMSNGISCYAAAPDTEDIVVERIDDRPSWCPLVPVPEHGRLIDADALKRLIDNSLFPSDMVTTRAVSMAVAWLNDATTIIPADKEGEG